MYICFKALCADCEISIYFDEAVLWFSRVPFRAHFHTSRLAFSVGCGGLNVPTCLYCRSEGEPAAVMCVPRIIPTPHESRLLLTMLLALIAV
jgi:hypothetical protein